MAFLDFMNPAALSPADAAAQYQAQTSPDVGNAIDYSGTVKGAGASAAAIWHLLQSLNPVSESDVANHPLNHGAKNEHRLDANELAALHTVASGAPNTYRPGGTSNYNPQQWQSPITPIGADNPLHGFLQQLAQSGSPEMQPQANAPDAQSLGWPAVDPSQATITAGGNMQPPLQLPSPPPELPQLATPTGIPYYPASNTSAVPGYSAAGVPQLQQSNPLLSIAAALLSGRGGVGNIGDVMARGSEVQRYQEMQNEHSALLAKQLYSGSPLQDLQKSQRGFLQARASQDVMSLSKAITSGQIPQDQIDPAWQQLQSRYSSLGVDIGPSPSVVTHYAAQSQSPEFLHAQLDEAIKGGDDKQITASMAHLLKDDPKSLAAFLLRKHEIDATNVQRQIQIGARQIASEEAEERKTLDSLAQGSSTHDMSRDVMGMHKSPAYSTALSTLEEYYARRKNEFYDSNGTNLGKRIINGYDIQNAPKNFKSFVTDVQKRAGITFDEQAKDSAAKPYVTFPPNAIPHSNSLTPSQKASAFSPDKNVDDPHTLAPMQDYANKVGMVVAGHNNRGELAYVTPDTIRR